MAFLSVPANRSGLRWCWESDSWNRDLRFRSNSAPWKCRTRKFTEAALNSDVACVLSHYEAASLLSLKKIALELPSTQDSKLLEGKWRVDLGRRALKRIVVTREGLNFNESKQFGADSCVAAHVTFNELQKMSKKGRSGAYECFKSGKISPRKIAGISPTTARTASLLPYLEGAPPTVVLGGFGMHRIKTTDAAKDTRSKVRALGDSAIGGEAIDICTGLGYTAIALAEFNSVSRVTTIELDPIMVEMQERNPWSESLFTNEKIERIVGDALQVLPNMPSDVYDVAIHDPPAQAMSGDLYSEKFYLEIARVLRSGGALFHYIGDPESEESGRLYRGVFHRLSNAGFRNLRIVPSAFGVAGQVSK